MTAKKERWQKEDCEKDCEEGDKEDRQKKKVNLLSSRKQKEFLRRHRRRNSFCSYP